MIDRACYHGGSECGGTFRCSKCRKLVGWCLGASDERPDYCDSCWSEWKSAHGARLNPKRKGAFGVCP